jgi:Zn-dependent protease
MIDSLHCLAVIDLSSAMTWAIVIGWILSVVLHEFAHGVIGYLGGDYTIKERGGLTLNPLQYIHPIYSLLLPAVFLLMGGVPLPGGVTYVRSELLRSRWWDAAVSAAGPVTNFILFLLLALPFHPKLGWIDTSMGVEQYQPWQIFLGAMAQLQMMGVILNLMPIPPLDGFGIVSPFMTEETRQRLNHPPVSTFAFFVIFLIAMQPQFYAGVFHLTDRILIGLGFDYNALNMMGSGFNLALFGRAS